MKTSLWRRAVPATTLPVMSMVRMFFAVISSRPTLCGFIRNSGFLPGRRTEIWPRVKSPWPLTASTLPAIASFFFNVLLATPLSRTVRIGARISACRHACYPRAKAFREDKMLRCLLAAICALGLSAAHAQDAYPSKPVTFITPAAAGNSPDVATRFIADRLTAIWKQQIVILNRPGAGGLIAAQAAAGVTPDGYTLYMTQA